jgi:hypothetical protein
VRVASCRSAVALEDGNLEGALEDALRLVRFARRVEDAQGGAVPYLWGLSCRRMGLEAFCRVVRRDGAPLERVRPFLEALDGESPSIEGLRDALRVEYDVLCRTVDGFARGDWSGIHPSRDPRDSPPRWLPTRVLFKPNQTKRFASDFYRPRAAWGGEAPCAVTAPDAPTVEESVARLPFSNQLGKVLLSLTLLEGSLLVSHRAQVRFVQEGLRAFPALRVHEVAEGRLPDSLEDLVPVPLANVPRDPFDGAPIRYDRETRVLYSVGRDCEDRGGSEEERFGEALWDDAEPTFRL